MKIHIQGRNDAVSKEAKSYAEEKVTKLERFFEGVKRVNVIMDKEERGFKVEIVCDVKPGGTIVVEESAATSESAFDLALDVVSRQLKKHKAKLRDKRNSPKSQLSPLNEKVDDDDLEDYDEWDEK